MAYEGNVGLLESSNDGLVAAAAAGTSPGKYTRGRNAPLREIPPHDAEEIVESADFSGRVGFDDGEEAPVAADTIPGKRKHTRDPDVPRRGRSAYVLFSTAAREEVKKGLPEGSK